MGPKIEAVVFDLGGVLIDYAGEQPLMKLANIASADELWRRWLSCQWVRRFERGDCSTDDFATGMVADWALPIEAAEFLALFSGWLQGPFAGADELVAEVQDAVAVGCLSNTNPLHWSESIGRWPILDTFDYRFLSFELGLVKPDVAMFQYVARRMPMSPSRVLFLDDNILNVEGARAAGFVAERVRGVDQARQALAVAGVLDA